MGGWVFWIVNSYAKAVGGGGRLGWARIEVEGRGGGEEGEGAGGDGVVETVGGG